MLATIRDFRSKATRSVPSSGDKDKIRTSVETTANGAVVVQTSDDPKVVAELQEHAAQVTDFAQEGMAAIHTAMMKKFGGRMPGGMMGPMGGMMHGRDAP